MEYLMPFGKQTIPIDIPDSINQKELALPELAIISQPQELLITSLKKPFKSKSLKNLIDSKVSGSIVIVVDDQTRKFPHKLILIPLLAYLKNSGISNNNITILIATGVHREPTQSQLEYLFGSKVVKNYKIAWNDQKHGKFVDYGTTKRGTPVQINEIYVNADIRILVTDVTLHYFAGFGGDRKSIFPGVASANSIDRNHSLVMQGIYPGTIENNPIHEDMMEAAEMVGADFVINVSLDNDGHILDIKSGALKFAFLEAVKNYEKICKVNIDEQADLLILSTGGYPFDSNYQQSMKAVMQCQNAVKKGGKILYFIRSENGIGIPAFENYLTKFPDSLSILKYTQNHVYQQGMHNAYYYRKFTEEHDVYYKTTLSRKYVTEILKVSFVENIKKCVEKLLENTKLVYIIRYGTKMMIQQKKNRME